MGLRSRITAWITGVLVVMSLFFYAFVHHQSRSVYLGCLDAALVTWGEQVTQEAVGAGGLSLHQGVDASSRFSGVPHLSLGLFLEGAGGASGADRFWAASGALEAELRAHRDLLGVARRKGRPVAETVVLGSGTFRLMALPPLGTGGTGSMVFAPVSAHPQGTEELSVRFALAVICLFLVVMAGGFLYSWYLIRPIELLRDVSEKIAEGNLDEGVQFSGSAEFVSLSHSINRMRRSIAETLRESEFQNQALVDKGKELGASNRELERAIFQANQMTSEAEIRSYELEHEVVQRRQAEEALRSSEEKYRTIVENMKEGYCEVDREGHVTFVNKAMCEITGYGLDEMKGMHRGHFILEESREQVLLAFERLFDGGEDVAEFDYPILRKDGRRRHIGVSVSLIRDASWERVGYRTIVRDVEARKRYEEELIYMAYHDPLTGLKNRKAFYERLEHDILRAKRYGGQVVLFYIDIDRFKKVNDTLGHEAGDEVLQEITRRLVENLRQCDCVARVGGDEFAVVLDNAGGCEVDVVFRKVVSMLAQPYQVGDRIVDYVSGSVGVASFPEDAVTANDLIRVADSAMYLAKRGGQETSTDCLEERV
ncbi:diguanylate cyclase [Desulfoluna sp.]|uniref:diguanylate cyclase domain-containing protein n=1 Tax=Desulfoluna sp. TaxID=2045199 RepID=UPI00260E005B|nr:diguanylate cyclase [Desulfoluna sp.]